MESTSTSNSSFDSDIVEKLEQSVYAIRLGDVNYEDSLKLAEEYKVAGNKLVTENKFSEAITKFTDAINLSIETNKNAIYYSNRANCHIKLENFGLALQDANKAIEIDKNYDKAYSRRASANLCLFHFEEAIPDLKFLIEKYPSEASLSDKLKKAQVENRKLKLFEALKDDDRSQG
jgi:serine/threonine-protein phosphatase 5